ncbi:MAG: Mur ligase domain-containing protein, partial [Thermomicrobiales bacterium]
MTVPALPPVGSRIHFVGIGGIGMSGLARMLQTMGYRVSGSDSTPSALLENLSALGICIDIGHAGSNVQTGIDLVIRTSAVSGENPEVAAAEHLGIPVMRRAELLGAMSRNRRAIAVAGT